MLSQRRVVTMNIKRLKDIGCYRGRRHIMVRNTVWLDQLVYLDNYDF